MNKPILIVCRDANLFGAYMDAYSEIEKYVARIISGTYTEERMREVIRALEGGGIYTIITRGIWYNRLLECEYLRARPYIHVEQMVIDSRVMTYQISTLVNSKYRRAGQITINSFYGKDPPNEADTMSFSSADLKIYTLVVKDLSNPLPDIQRLIDRYHVDIFWGDAGDFAEYLEGYPILDFAVRGMALIDMIHRAVDYANAYSLQQENQRVLEFLNTITRVVSEGVLMLNENGDILHRNENFIFDRLGAGQERITNIRDLLGMKIADVLQLKPNTLLQLKGHNYIVNVITRPPGQARASYAVILNSRGQISDLELSARAQLAKNTFPARYTFENIVSNDPITKNAIATAKAYAAFDETVLITGETGTGKELFASSIHRASPRRANPFVAINCATFSESLIDSELFGYEKGSFTGALNTGKKGLFELAHQGTIFLDEISELPLSLQARLLRVLQEKSIMRIGGKEVIPINVRVIAATNKDLVAQCNKGAFRRDLYYRLAILELGLSPLRERRMDIIPLFQYFLKKNAELTSRKILWDSDEPFEPLLLHPWSGNIRELENVALRTSILAKNIHLTQKDIQNALYSGCASSAAAGNSFFTTKVTNDLNELEREYISYLMRLMNNSKDEVCNYLSISKPTLWRKLNYGKSAGVSGEEEHKK